MTFLHQEEVVPNTRLKELSIATVAALGVFFGAAAALDRFVGESSSPDPVIVTTALSKSDRMNATLPLTCNGQAWGNWSADCVSAITGGETTRNIRRVTFEERDFANRTSTLVRVAAR
ncbi:hypothetical protein H2509_06675 [Stappia sp. F7233]|uniref:Uncharacterized protein n=1 Tax=Stappia albiluteola TaxID=2758565 RepID=A0A839ABK7_9HYPH|nr:hypothetical protein [Stappia albiluteola]MBA5776811.1 hypothetical protein [Stappia albiluteola]